MSWPLFFAAKFPYPLLHVLPLCVTIALVYAATRYENMRPVLLHSLRLFLMTLTFLLIVAGVLYAIDTTF